MNIHLAACTTIMSPTQKLSDKLCIELKTILNWTECPTFLSGLDLCAIAPSPTEPLSWLLSQWIGSWIRSNSSRSQMIYVHSVHIYSNTRKRALKGGVPLRSPACNFSPGLQGLLRMTVAPWSSTSMICLGSFRLLHNKWDLEFCSMSC